ncbi:MAG: HAMP domain-containing protein, partial [Clostridia bacterium]|nr:HAMP domain-containing protein [Deltaproteobacteria bacterium]
MSLLGFHRWPLRIKMVALLLIASSVPVVVAAIITFANARTIIVGDAGELLGARADQLVSELDGFHHVYTGLSLRLGRYAPIVESCSAGIVASDAVRDGLNTSTRAILETDTNIMGFTLVNDAGGIIWESEGPTAVTIAARRAVLSSAASGGPFVSDIYLARPNAGALPVISYGAPLSTPNRTCAAILHVRASAFWDAVRAANGRTGEGSYTVVLNAEGIRIAHSFRQNQVFHPTGPVSDEDTKRLVEIHQYGQDTEALLADAVSVPDEYERARMPLLNNGKDSMYTYAAPETGETNYGIARRMGSVKWTVVAVTPSRSVIGPVNTLIRRTAWISTLIVFAALALGFWFSERISQPLRIMSAVAEDIAGGNLKARVSIHTADEFGALGTSLNRMTEALAKSY